MPTHSVRVAFLLPVLAIVWPSVSHGQMAMFYRNDGKLKTDQELVELGKALNVVEQYRKSEQACLFAWERSLDWEAGKCAALARAKYGNYQGALQLFDAVHALVAHAGKQNEEFAQDLRRQRAITRQYQAGQMYADQRRPRLEVGNVEWSKKGLLRVELTAANASDASGKLGVQMEELGTATVVWERDTIEPGQAVDGHILINNNEIGKSPAISLTIDGEAGQRIPIIAPRHRWYGNTLNIYPDPELKFTTVSVSANYGAFAVPYGGIQGAERADWVSTVGAAIEVEQGFGKRFGAAAHLAFGKLSEATFSDGVRNGVHGRLMGFLHARTGSYKNLLSAQGGVGVMVADYRADVDSMDGTDVELAGSLALAYQKHIGSLTLGARVAFIQGFKTQAQALELAFQFGYGQ